jgi:hypothetical protein
MHVPILSICILAMLEEKEKELSYSFFRSARAASVGPDDWIRMTSIRSTTPPMS